MIKRDWILQLTIAGLIFTGISQAEPYMAVRGGYKCSQCHFNQTGGGKRTDFGVLYSQYQLATFGVAPDSGAGSSFNPQLNETVSIGTNFRTNLRQTFDYSTDDTTIAEEARQVEGIRTTSNPEANLYIQANLIPGLFSFYLDQTMTPAPGNREMFGMLHLPVNSWVKVGRMLLPYGYRMLDDDAFIRRETNFTYNRHDRAVEIGTEPGPYPALLNGSFSFVVNANLENWSTVGSVNWRYFRVGGSYANLVGNETEVGKLFGGDNQIYGVFSGVNFGRFTILGEFDWIQQPGNGDTTITKQVALAELDFHLIKGVNLRGVYEYLNRNVDIPNERDGKDRITFGVNTFPLSFLELSFLYTINRDIPQNVDGNQDLWIAQFHTYF